MSQEKHVMEIFQRLPADKQSQAIDFLEWLEAKIQNQKPAQTVQRVGSMKGLVEYISEDFDAPLEDFAEYME